MMEEGELNMSASPLADSSDLALDLSTKVDRVITFPAQGQEKNGEEADVNTETDMNVDASTEHEYSMWELLPDVVIQNIYSFLRDNDRAAMSYVCKRWSSIFHMPRLWRKRKFRFGGIRCNRNEHERAIGFAKSHGTDLRELVVTCDHPSYVTCKRVQKTLQTFWAIISGRKGQLEEITICQLYVDRYWRYDWARERFVGSIARFLRSQKSLKYFDMSESMLPIANGFKIMDSLGQGSGRVITSLNIEDFFHTRAAVFRIPRFQCILSLFKSLRTLYTNYNCLSDEVIQVLSRNCQPSLQNFSIKIYKHDPHFHRIDPSSWRRLRGCCPNLRVNMYFEGIGRYEEIEPIAIRDVPLFSLQIWTGVHHHDEEWRLNETFKHIGNNLAGMLEEISLGIENGREDVDEGLLYMLSKCKKLEQFDLQGVILVNTIEEICRLQEEFKLGLVRCHVIAENLTGIEVDELEHVNDKYHDMIKDRGLDFHFTSNDMPYL